MVSLNILKHMSRITLKIPSVAVSCSLYKDYKNKPFSMMLCMTGMPIHWRVLDIVIMVVMTSRHVTTSSASRLMRWFGNEHIFTIELGNPTLSNHINNASTCIDSYWSLHNMVVRIANSFMSMLWNNIKSWTNTSMIEVRLHLEWYKIVLATLENWKHNQNKIAWN